MVFLSEPYAGQFVLPLGSVVLVQAATVNDADDFFLLFFGNSDAFESFFCRTISTNQRFIIHS